MAGTYRIADLYTTILKLENSDILHIEEAHAFPRQCQTVMLDVLDKHVIVPACGGMALPIADFTLILSTTNRECLLPPLRDRIKIDLSFDYYSEAELCNIIEEYCHNLEWKIDTTIIPEIAKKGYGIPRIALRLLQSVRRYCVAYDIPKMEKTHLLEACRLGQIDDLGLNKNEQDYLRLLAKHETAMQLCEIARL